MQTTQPIRRATRRANSAYPAAAGITGADVHEDHGYFVLRAEIDGLDGNHLGVSLDHGDLVVSGEIEDESLGFYRRLPLPFDTEGADLAVHFSHGCLEVRIPIPEIPEISPDFDDDVPIH
jgi:HSP20 family molecular chaperone IbpA